MLEWFNSLGLMGQIFLCIALPASVILVIQIVLSIVGLGHDGDGDADVPDDNGIDGVFGEDAPDDTPDVSAGDTADLQIFSLRSIIAFIVTFGWMGVSLCKTGLHPAIIVTIALGCGVAVMLLVAVMMRAIWRLQSDGTADIRDALGKTASVYLTIPAGRAGKGKVNVMLSGSLAEREAVTDDAEPIPFGTEVTVVGITGGTTLLVTRKR